ncbi:MAG: DUF502 domain-containing protein, partial [Pirellulaceae bacterium]|nr:DUF502 domain-containing protein [Pirellulaceae bacterium]
MKKAIKTFGFLKTTAIGGLFFLLPLIVLGALIGQIVPVVRVVTNVLSDQFPAYTASNAAVLVVVAIAIIISACFVAGVLARRSIGKRISLLFEKNISMLFPRYTIIKEQMKGSIGGDSQKTTMKPVFVQLQDHRRIGFEIERINEQLIAVYLPGAPDAWAGNIVYV